MVITDTRADSKGLPIIECRKKATADANGGTRVMLLLDMGNEIHNELRVKLTPLTAST